MNATTEEWTVLAAKTSKRGQLVEVVINEYGMMRGRVDGVDQGFNCTRVMELTGEIRKEFYPNAPAIATHAVGHLLFEREDGAKLMDAWKRSAEERIQKGIAAQLAEYASQLQEARATGQPVIVERWEDDCDGSVSECSTDHCCRKIHPDGTFTIHRIHSH
jgi:hypothetical protein